MFQEKYAGKYVKIWGSLTGKNFKFVTDMITFFKGPFILFFFESNVFVFS